MRGLTPREAQALNAWLKRMRDADRGHAEPLVLSGEVRQRMGYHMGRGDAFELVLQELEELTTTERRSGH